jgi:hypothetical protein
VYGRDNRPAGGTSARESAGAAPAIDEALIVLRIRKTETTVVTVASSNEFGKRAAKISNILVLDRVFLTHCRAPAVADLLRIV